MKILIVEDRIKTGDDPRQGLQEAGFAVDLVRDGVDGQHYALIILNTMLPGLDGWKVMEGMRQSWHDIPVLFLTARDNVDEQASGLELGADDYAVTPFAFAERLARVRSLPPRGRARNSETFQVADLHLDILRRRALSAKQGIDITARDFALPERLMRRQGEALPRLLIASQVRDMKLDRDSNVVETAIRRLRARVGDPFSSELFHTVRGMGCVMEERDTR
jgi:two-component system, OmpR family, copper resistance phosphate regulon response regulator CusR